MKRRRYLGYFILLVNLPLLIWKAYEVAVGLSAGAQLGSPDIVNDLVLLASSVALVFFFPRWLPVYASRYWLTETGLKISRLLKGTFTIPYASIARAEIYVKDKKRGKVSKEAMQYAREASDSLRKTGFKFTDYTNDDDAIVLLISGNRVYLISPAYPKAFAQKLRKRVGDLPVKMVELTPRGKRVREI
jgi:hypothetical protein